ncbi:MAG: hypothetical protein KJZ83_03585 [Burkholderiaceae bacterium]|nr:hypothetical protein [Burkholderiaceae bacterium]
MTATGIVLGLHIACGTGALICGAVSMCARKSRGLHSAAGETYHWLFAGILVSGCTLAFLDWQRLWWFVPVAAFSYAFALLGYLSAKLRWKNWLRHHLAGQGGSYISMITAVLVVNVGVGSWWAWVLPTIVGTPLIAWVTREVARGRRPRYR